MKLNEFQNEALQTGKGLPNRALTGTSKKDVLRSRTARDEIQQLFVAARLVEEAGEVAGVVKRDVFNGSMPETSSRIQDELGDVLHAVAYIAHVYGLNLERIAKKALKKQAAKGYGIRG